MERIILAETMLTGVSVDTGILAVGFGGFYTRRQTKTIVKGQIYWMLLRYQQGGALISKNGNI